MTNAAQPTAPTGLNSISKTDVQITMSWTKVSGATSYIVSHRLTGQTAWISSANLGDVSAYTVTGLSASTNYDITVTAINTAGTSP